MIKKYCLKYKQIFKTIHIQSIFDFMDSKKLKLLEKYFDWKAAHLKNVEHDVLKNELKDLELYNSPEKWVETHIDPLMSLTTTEQSPLHDAYSGLFDDNASKQSADSTDKMNSKYLKRESKKARKTLKKSKTQKGK